MSVDVYLVLLILFSAVPCGATSIGVGAALVIAGSVPYHQATGYKLKKLGSEKAETSETKVVADIETGNFISVKSYEGDTYHEAIANNTTHWSAVGSIAGCVLASPYCSTVRCDEN